MKPARQPEYLKWIRKLACVVCGSRCHVEAAHTGPRGMGQKSPDTSAIPLCARHHRTGSDSYHRLGAREFAEHHRLDIPAIVRRLNSKPIVRVEAVRFVAYFDGEPYLLGPVEKGLAAAMRALPTIRAEQLLEMASLSAARF